jgi:hypothetical protein
MGRCVADAELECEYDDKTRVQVPRQDALGVGIKVISGDNRFVTAHLAEVLGLGPPSMLAGDEISEMSDEALWHEGSLL